MQSDVPVHEGYAKLLGGFDSTLGGFARGEVGVHVLQPLSVFGFGQVDQKNGGSAGLGARLTFDL